MKFAVAQNAVIWEDDGKRVKYSAKCPTCGQIESFKYTITVNPSSGMLPKNCSKCKARYRAEIRRS